MTIHNKYKYKHITEVVSNYIYIFPSLRILYVYFYNCYFINYHKKYNPLILVTSNSLDSNDIV